MSCELESYHQNENEYDDHQQNQQQNEYFATDKSQQTDPTQRQSQTQTSPLGYINNMEPISQPLDSLNEEDEDQLIYNLQEDEPQSMALEDNNDNNNNCGQDVESQLALLRNLLQIERQNNETRRRNNVTLQKYLQQLQTDYLRQQQDLIEALELSNKIREQKDSQLAIVDETLREKDHLIEQLRQNLASLDEEKLRAEIQETLEKQKRLARLEQEQLKDQINSVEQQLVRERVSNSQLLQQFQDKLDDQVKFHERELESVQARLAKSQTELERVIGEPQNLVIKALREDKCKLESQVEELTSVLDESRNKYDGLRKRIESLSSEQEQNEQRNQEEIDRLQQQYVEQRRQVNELKLELEDKQEIMQILQFNLQRSEKRVKNLLSALKSKESTYKEMIEQMELKHEQEIERSTANVRILEKRLLDIEGQLDKKQNELVKLQLWQENQSESMRNDRDERINRLMIEKARFEKELQSAEIKLARECEHTKEKTKLIEQLQKDVNHFKEESKRLSIELTKSEAILYAKQQELQKALEQRRREQQQRLENTCDEQLHQQLSFDLEESRKHSRRLERSIEELKKDNEKLSMKLRIADTNLTKMSSAINREHTRMLHEYEKKLHQIREEQCAFDSSKLRYKRYSHKLKKYCEHLKQVHEHMCNPSTCGYAIGPMRTPPGLGSSSASPSLSKRSRRDSLGPGADNTSSIGFGSLSDQRDENNDSDSADCADCEAYIESKDIRHNFKSSQQQQLATGNENNKREQSERFVIKRTSLSSSISPSKVSTKRNITSRSTKPAPSRTTVGPTSTKSPLKPINNQLFGAPRPSNRAQTEQSRQHQHQQQPSSTAVQDHKYYYINEDALDDCCSTSPRGRIQRAVI